MAKSVSGLALGAQKGEFNRSNLVQTVRASLTKRNAPMVKKLVQECPRHARFIVNDGLVTTVAVIDQMLKAVGFYGRAMMLARAMEREIGHPGPYAHPVQRMPNRNGSLGRRANSLHDLHKNAVSIMSGGGNGLIDLGVDVPEFSLPEGTRKHDPEIVVLWSPLTSGTPHIKTAIEELAKGVLRGCVLVTESRLQSLTHSTRRVAGPIALDAAASTVVALALLKSRSNPPT